jgi:hypothetical protein
MTASFGSRWLLLAAAAAAVLLAGCGLFGSGAGPVHPWTVNGTPYAGAGTLGVEPGQSTDFEVYVVNDANVPVVVTAARLIKMPGHPSGHLVHVAVETGKNRVLINRNWPPEDVGVRRMIGSTLPHGRVFIAVGFTARHPGMYVVAGIRLTYRTGGHTYHTNAWGGAASCIHRTKHGFPPPCPHSDHLINSIMDYINQQ